ncbi:MAG: hypothetical protein WCP07_12130 [bacterium]|jgi:hypothetical protein
MEMKKEISPAIIIGAIVVVLALVGYFIYQSLNATAPISLETSKAPPMVNGKPVPPGVPYDYATKIK